MIPRGLRIFLALSLLLVLSSNAESRADKGIKAIVYQGGAVQLPPDLPYQFSLPIISKVPTPRPTPPPTFYCNVVYQNPPNNTFLAPGSAFDMRWTIKNTSSQAWLAESSDIRFVSGDRMHTGADQRDIPYKVLPDSVMDIVVGMASPNLNGRYTEVWAIYTDSTSVCSFFVTINVP